MNDERRTYCSTYDRLRAEGFAPEQALQIRAKVSVSENGKRYHLKTNGQEESAVFGVDGYIVKEGAKCDKLVLVKQPNGNAPSEQWTEIFVELKGVDTSHAIEQLRQTLSKSIFRHPSNNDIRARIVAHPFFYDAFWNKNVLAHGSVPPVLKAWHFKKLFFLRYIFIQFFC